TVDPSRQYRLMVAVVHDQSGTAGKAAFQPGPEPFPACGGFRQPRVILGVLGIGETGKGKAALSLKLTGRHQPATMRTVIGVGQHIKKPRRRVVGDPFGMGSEHGIQEQRIGICRLETPDIEGWRKVINENAFADANRTVELIIVEKTAPAARYERGLV